MLAELVRGTESAGDPICCDTGGDFGPGEILISAQSEILVLVRMADNYRIYSSMFLSCILTLHTRHRQPRVGIQGRLGSQLPLLTTAITVRTKLARMYIVKCGMI